MIKDKNKYIPWLSNAEVEFAALFIAIFFISFVGLYLIGLIPTEFQVNTNDGVIGQIQNDLVNTQEATTTPTKAEPTEIKIPSIGLDSVINNPTSNDNNILDNELTKGVVHYPGSGYPGVGNMFLFGHSTGFKIVNNKAYQVFDNIKNLNTGDQIEVYADNKVYTYSVTSVKMENEYDALVDFSTNKNMLTMSTCDSFGTKEDRYVVTADYVGVDNI